MGLKDHDEEVTRKGWNIVERNQNRISALVMDMLTFSKEREPDLTTADLNAVVADVIELMRVRADELQVELEKDAEQRIVPNGTEPPRQTVFPSGARPTPCPRWFSIRRAFTVQC